MDSIQLLSNERRSYSKTIKKKLFLYLLILTIYVNIFIIYNFSIFKNDIKQIKKNLSNIINKTIISNDDEKELNNYKNFENNIYYNTNIIKSYIKHQKEFCNNPNKYYDYLYENQITLQNFSLKNISYKIYVYKKYDIVSHIITRNKNFEGHILLNCLNALKYYAKKKNIINNKNIYILDIGGNIGVYPLYLGRFGYSILSFEPSPKNFYISKKNYCLNQNLNIIIINKGLSSEEKKCDYYTQKNNIGNGIILCNKINNKKIKKNFIKINNVLLTKINNFIPFLSDKNIALIKMDVEGGEGKVIEGGIELLTKYHVPFIVLEFTPIYLREHNTDPVKFLQLFCNNGYKISLKGFLSNSFISINDIMKKHRRQINLYLIYKRN